MSTRVIGVANGVTDDREAFQTAFDIGAGGEVVIPAGRYAIGPPPSGWASLTVRPGTRVIADGEVVLEQAPCPPSTRMIYVNGDKITLEELTLDGLREDQPDQDQHRAGVIVDGHETTLAGLQTRNFTGDGVYIHEGSDLVVESLVSINNRRNGLTFGGEFRGALVVDAKLVNNGAQQLDTEAPLGTINDFTLVHSLLHGRNGYALTISGSANDRKSRNWVVEDNVINGGINIVWAVNVLLQRNRGLNESSQSPIRVWRTCERVTICDNDFRANSLASDWGVISIYGTEGGAPRGTRVMRNRLTCLGEDEEQIGISAVGAGDVHIIDNDIYGPEHGQHDKDMAIFLRATGLDAPFDLALLRGNSLINWRKPVVVFGNGDARLKKLILRDTTLDNVSSGYEIAGTSETIHSRTTIVGAGPEQLMHDIGDLVETRTDGEEAWRELTT